jgi:hypothetical protein
MHWLQEARAFLLQQRGATPVESSDSVVLHYAGVLSVSIGKIAILLATLDAVGCKPSSTLCPSVSSHKGAACAVSWHSRL